MKQGMNKGTLLLATFFLGMVAANYSSVMSADAQQNGFEYVKPMGVSSSGNGVFLLDSRDGQMWLYDLTTGRAHDAGRLQQLGDPLLRPQSPRFGTGP